MSLSVAYLEGSRFEATCRGHTIVVDQPELEGGSDKGMTPVELFNVSLASCVAHSAVTFLKRRIPDLQNLIVQSDWQYADNPHRVVAMHIHLIVPRELTDPETKGLQRTIEQCTVSNTLKGVPKIDIQIVAKR
jgi:putative redox protein